VPDVKNADSGMPANLDVFNMVPLVSYFLHVRSNCVYANIDRIEAVQTI
jgi:hypothetical protein